MRISQYVLRLPKTVKRLLGRITNSFKETINLSIEILKIEVGSKTLSLLLKLSEKVIYRYIALIKGLVYFYDKITGCLRTVKKETITLISTIFLLLQRTIHVILNLSESYWTFLLGRISDLLETIDKISGLLLQTRMEDISISLKITFFKTLYKSYDLILTLKEAIIKSLINMLKDTISALDHIIGEVVSTSQEVVNLSVKIITHYTIIKKIYLQLSLSEFLNKIIKRSFVDITKLKDFLRGLLRRTTKEFITLSIKVILAVTKTRILLSLSLSEYYQKFMKTIETRYFRSDEHAINDLSAYKFGTSQTDSDHGTLNTSTTCNFKWGIRVWKRSSSGSETEITNGSPVAVVTRTSTGEGIQSNTWSCPETSLQSTDAIVVRVYNYRNGSWYQEEPWITEQLEAIKLLSSTWTVYYYTKVTYSSTLNKYKAEFHWGKSTVNSRVEGFSYAK